MARRVNPSQLRSMMRQAQSRQRQAVAKYNREARAHNQTVKRAVDKYNHEVRTHNSRVRANRQQLKNEISRLQRQASKPRYVTFRASVDVLHQTYVQLEKCAEAQNFDNRFDEMLDLSEREAANNLAVMNALLREDADADADEEEIDPQASELTNELKRIAPDLDCRWRGALFALSPRNPDAARHFCTSAREVITVILDTKAPDTIVLDETPDCTLTDKGKPTRRSKIRYFLRCKGISEQTLEEFIEKDIENVMALFRVFNDGTHGSAGRFNLGQLVAIRKRVENAIMFLARLV